MAERCSPARPQWQRAASLLPPNAPQDPGLQGALVPDDLRDNDRIAVVYDRGRAPPRITIRAVSGTVHAVLADGIAIAVVAKAQGPAPCEDDVLLVERVI